MGGGRQSGQAGFALVEILLVIVIIGLLAVGYYGLSGPGEKGQEQEKSIPARSIDKAKSAQCASNLNQCRQLIEMYVIEHGEYPKKFNPGQQGSIGTCPVSGKPYVYNPQTGEIHCTTPGHENL
ncbi:MAG: prepilin-type N-terminal cleavage/methylation domain-containing protein [Armatimonadota bacterium]|nr:prepilin-type N-terminal cleavage/methylation domain-containing protein [Armatimonadota bacterium]